MKNYNGLKISMVVMRAKEAAGPQIVDGGDIAKMFEDIKEMAQEGFFVVLLDTKLKVMDRLMISLGTLNEALVHPREVFRPAIQQAANSVILVHNHPSGSTEPSANDRELTRRMVEAGKIIGISVVDHVIVSRNGHYSFVENGLF